MAARHPRPRKSPLRQAEFHPWDGQTRVSAPLRNLSLVARTRRRRAAAGPGAFSTPPCCGNPSQPRICPHGKTVGLSFRSKAIKVAHSRLSSWRNRFSDVASHTAHPTARLGGWGTRKWQGCRPPGTPRLGLGDELGERTTERLFDNAKHLADQCEGFQDEIELGVGVRGCIGRADESLPFRDSG